MAPNLVQERARKLFRSAEEDLSGEATAPRLREALGRSKWPKFIAFDIERLLRLLLPDGAADSSRVGQEQFCREFCNFYMEWLQAEDSSAKGRMMRPSLPRIHQNQESNQRDSWPPPGAERQRQLLQATEEGTKLIGIGDTRGHPAHLQQSPAGDMMPNSGMSTLRATAARQMRHSYSTGAAGRTDRTSSAARQMRHSYSTGWAGRRTDRVDRRPDRSAAWGDGRQVRASRWTDPGEVGAKRARRDIVPHPESSQSDRSGLEPLPYKGPVPGRLSRDRSGAKRNHLVTGSQHLNKLVGQQVFDSIIVTDKDMAQFLHIFVDMEVSPDGTVSRSNFMTHIGLTAPNLAQYAMRLYDKALDSSLTRASSKGGVKEDKLDFRRLLHCIFPAASQLDVNELVRMATCVRLTALGEQERAARRAQPWALRYAQPRELFSRWNTSETGRLTMDECFEGMDALMVNGQHTLSLTEIRHSLEELYRVDDGKERGGQLNYMRNGMAEAEYVRSVTLPEFTAWMKTSTKNTASLYS